MIRYILIFFLLLFGKSLLAQELVNLKPNVTVHIGNNALVKINGGIDINASATLTQRDNSTLQLTGNWLNSGTYVADTSITEFTGSQNQLIAGANSSTFYNFFINKASGTFDLGVASTINGTLRLLSNTLLDINSFNLTLGPDTRVYTNMAIEQNFDSARCIHNSLGAGGGFVRKNIATSQTLPFNIVFPVGTTGDTCLAYSGVDLTLRAGYCLFSAGAYIQVRPVPGQHPIAELADISLKKYWTFDYANMTVNPEGANLVLQYSQTEVRGSEGNYKVLLYSPAYPDVLGYWRVNPGITNQVVDFNADIIYSSEVSELKGDWTAGEEEAAVATYYSRADGDYNNVTTWSRQGFSGPVSATIPNKRSDRVRIKDHVVTISSAVSEVGILTVEENATLRFQGNNFIEGDSLKVFATARLDIGHVNGITDVEMSGAIQTDARQFSEDAVYNYTGTDTLQFSGDGLPSPLKCLMVTKAAGDTLQMSKIVNVTDSLVINNGILDIYSYNINGYTSGRSLIMRNGELIVRNTFPTNYTTPTFTVGKITFFGTGGASIPSHLTSPAVNQYYDLRIAGTRNGTVTLPNVGEIRIKNNFDIGNLAYVGSNSFYTNGSTVVFNRNGGIQNIPARPASPADSNSYLRYYNLILDSSGTKRLQDVGTPLFIVLNDLTIRDDANFALNGFNLEVQGDWVNFDAGSVFTPGTNTVIFRSQVPLSTIFVNSRSTVENPFHHLVSAGPGIVAPSDNIKVGGNFRIDSLSTFQLNVYNMDLSGNWRNHYGTFDYSTSTVNFIGSVNQTITKTTGSENYYNFFLNNAAGADATAVGTTANDGVVINADLTLQNGVLRTRGRHATALDEVLRPGGSPGHVDGALRKPVAANSSDVVFETGYLARYTPFTLSVGGSGGTAGLVSVLSDTVTAASTPTTNNGTAITPANSFMSAAREVRRQWTLSVPSASTFVLGPDRKYSATMRFLVGNNPLGDMNGGATATLFEGRLWTGTEWIFPKGTGSPMIGTRSGNTFQYDSLSSFGTFIIGEPSFYTFYTRSNGNWTTPSVWSTQKYGGVPSTVVPGTNATAYIGNNNSVTLDANVTINNTLAPDPDGVINLDSTGTLLCGTTNVISGTGEFRQLAMGTLATGNANGIAATGSTGSIQTTTRNFNYNTHNKSIWVYNGNLAQTQGSSAVPDTLLRLIIEKTSSAVNFQYTNRVITDSLLLRSGTFNLTAANMFLRGHMRRHSGAIYTPNTGTITFNGTDDQYIRDDNSDSLVFNNLTMTKTAGRVRLDAGSPIAVTGTLTFSGTNRAVIDATNASNYVLATGTVTRTAGDSTGHIFGEMRKLIAAADAAAMMFQVGDSLNYSPFQLDMRNGTGSVAGILGVRCYPFDYPYFENIAATNDTIPPIYSGRIIHRYFRLTRPPGSAFVRGTRNFDVRAEYLNPSDWDQLDDYTCTDMAMKKDYLDSLSWESMWPSSAGICSDTRNMANLPQFANTAGTGSASYLVYLNLANVTKPWGTTRTLPDGSLQLADFIMGQQNGKANFITFFSRQSGDWTDPNTWSTVSHTSNINNADVIEPTYNVRKIPIRQYDNVFIDSSHTVRMNATIGSNNWTTTGGSGTGRHLGFVGPNVTVKSRGTLDLSLYELFGNAFKVDPGGTLIVGSIEGINQTAGSNSSPTSPAGLGNIKTLARTFADSINIIYSASGNTSNMNGRSYYNYCALNMTNNTRQIRQARILNGATPIMTNSTGTTLWNELWFNDYVAEVNAGSSYNVEVQTDPASLSRRLHLHVDWNRDGDFVDAGESSQGSTVNATTLTVPLSVPASQVEGSYRLRVIMRTSSVTTNVACTASDGEAEDYTLYVKNSTGTFAQVTGTGLPNIVSSISTRVNRAGSTVTLGKQITVIDSVKIRSGQFVAGANDIYLTGNWVNDTVNGFSAGTGRVHFTAGNDQFIQGTQPTTFNKMVINKDSNDVFVQKDFRVNDTLRFARNAFLELADGDSITFGSGSNLTSTTNPFSNKRMIRVSGTAASGTLVKEFTTSAGAKAFVYPVGIDTAYNYADLSITGSYSATPSLSVKLRDGKHPARLNEKIIKKYWTVRAAGISTPTANSFKFNYIAGDTAGNALRYIPGIRNLSNAWEINLGTTPIGNPSPFTLTNNASMTGAQWEGDYTAGESSTFFDGRQWYSRATGNWNNPNNWSNVGHAGPIASYYPGELFTKDTVFIDGHTITFNVDSTRIDSLTLGGSFAGTNAAGRGILNFGASPLIKKFNLNSSLLLNVDGRIEGATPGNRYDTLFLSKNIQNNALLANTAGIFFRQNATNYITLKLDGDTASYINGTGHWGDFADMILNKTGGLSDTLFINSSSFAAQTLLSNGYKFTVTKGVLKQYNNYETSLAFGSTAVAMGSDAGLTVTSGTLSTTGNLTNNVNTRIDVLGGTLRVGDASNENLLYQSGSVVNISNGTLQVAGQFSGVNSTSNVDFSMSNNSLARILAQGSSDVTRYGFDIRNAGSGFSMSNGRVVVARSVTGGTSDFFVNATGGTGMTGGEIQLGDSTITPAATEIKAGGSLEIYNLHSVGNNVTTKISSTTLTVKNNLFIDNNNTFNLNTNTLTLRGNLTNYGLFNSNTLDVTANPRRLILSGTGNQTIYNDDSPGLELYNLQVQKTAGNVILSGTGNSNLIIRNILEFSTGNNAIINSIGTNYNRYVEMSPVGLGSPQIIRNGLGHIYGRLYRHFTGATAITRRYLVGGDTVTKYRPMEMTTVGGGGTAGLVGGLLVGTYHPRVDSALTNGDKYVLHYWKLLPATSGGYSLGADQNFNLKLQFKNPEDIRGGANPNFFDQWVYNPACPDPHLTCPPATGAWSIRTNAGRTDTTNTSSANRLFGDFIVGEPSGLTFYSIANGFWMDANSWSLDGYAGTPAPRYPNISTDNVKIGNSRNITMQDNIFHEQVKSVLVENYLGNKGHLTIGKNVVLKSSVFEIKDSCKLTISNVIGIDQTPTAGVIQSTSKVFGVANYEFFSTGNLSQITGNGFPDSVASIVLDNNGTSNQKLFVSTYGGAPAIRVMDSIAVKDGDMELSSREMKMYGDIIMSNGTFWTPSTARVTFSGPKEKNIKLGNTNGISIYDLDLNGGDINLSLQSGGDADNAHMRVFEELSFIDTTVIKTRATNRKVIVYDTTFVERVSPASGYVDGTMSRGTRSGTDSTFFVIGYADEYTPATVRYISGTGSAGFVDGISYRPVPYSVYTDNRLDSVRKVNVYWSLTGSGGFAMGSRLANVNLGFPVYHLSNIDTNKAVVRRKSIPAETYLWTERSGADLDWTASAANVYLSPSSALWPGLGEFYIGEKFRRIFYSRNDGLWSSNTTWAFDPAGTIPAPPGVFPNEDYNLPDAFELETNDSVVIQNDDHITLNTRPELNYLRVKDNAKLTFLDTTYVSQTQGVPSMLDFTSGTIEIRSPYGIEIDTSMSLLRFTQANMSISNNMSFEFTGNQRQTMGGLFPAQVSTLLVNNTGTGNNDIVAFPFNGLLVRDDFRLLNGDLRTIDLGFKFQIGGDMTINDTLDLTIDSTGSDAPASLEFVGSGSDNQVLSGTGHVDVISMSMNRGAGTGVVLNQTTINVEGTFDLQRDPVNTNNQIFEIGAGGELNILDYLPTAIVDYSAGPSPIRYIRTSKDGGCFNRNVTFSQTYVFPVGSFEAGMDIYSPATLATGATGAPGSLCIKADAGTNGTVTGAHANMSASTTDYIKRYWAIQDVTATMPGAWTFNYNNADITGTEAAMIQIGQWTAPNEGVGGSWNLITGPINYGANTFGSPAAMPASAWTGDWTIGNMAAFRRIFYSRQNGVWNDPNSWTSSPTHIGAPYGTGIFPSSTADSVVIGGGNAGVNNHEISLNMAAAVGGISVGTSTVNTGTFDMNDFILSGQYFRLMALSTIKIGSAAGITSLGNATGNVQTTLSRSYSDSAHYVYDGSVSQAAGSGLPAIAGSLTVANSGPVANNTVTLSTPVSIRQNLSVMQGRLDLGTVAAPCIGTGGIYTIASGATMRVGGTNNLLTTVSGYSSYSVDANSLMEFYGSDQLISSLPPLLTSGLGHVLVNNVGNKTVSSPLLVRGDLTIANSATLVNNVGVNSLEVYGDVLNDATINNSGVIRIGN